jgi:hypothetical protein
MLQVLPVKLAAPQPMSAEMVQPRSMMLKAASRVLPAKPAAPHPVSVEMVQPRPLMLEASRVPSAKLTAPQPVSVEPRPLTREAVLPVLPTALQPVSAELLLGVASGVLPVTLTTPQPVSAGWLNFAEQPLASFLREPRRRGHRSVRRRSIRPPASS